MLPPPPGSALDDDDDVDTRVNDAIDLYWPGHIFKVPRLIPEAEISSAKQTNKQTNNWSTDKMKSILKSTHFTTQRTKRSRQNFACTTWWKVMDFHLPGTWTLRHHLRLLRRRVLNSRSRGCGVKLRDYQETTNKRVKLNSNLIDLLIGCTRHLLSFIKKFI